MPHDGILAAKARLSCTQPDVQGSMTLRTLAGPCAPAMPNLWNHTPPPSLGPVSCPAPQLPEASVSRTLLFVPSAWLLSEDPHRPACGAIVGIVSGDLVAPFPSFLLWALQCHVAGYIQQLSRAASDVLSRRVAIPGGEGQPGARYINRAGSRICLELF